MFIGISEEQERPNATYFNDIMVNPTWTYDTVTGVVTASGTYVARSPAGAFIAFTRTIDDLSIGGGLAASATSYSCAEGNFGSLINATLCGTYEWGSNMADESSLSYGPGTAFSFMLGGDDGWRADSLEHRRWFTRHSAADVLELANEADLAVERLTTSTGSIGGDWINLFARPAEQTERTR